MRGTSILLGAVALVLSSPPVWPGDLTSQVEDPAGDAIFDPGEGATGAEPYQDIIRAEITKRGGMFLVAMSVTAPIPDSPPLQPGTKNILWSWAFDTNPATAPVGFPDPPGISSPLEFWVDVIWDGTSFAARLIDRRPLLAGQQALITRVPFKVKGTEITAVVDDSLIGDPSSFQWLTVTSLLWGLDGSFGLFLTDITLPLATWPL